MDSEKGYEVAKGEYMELDPEELEAVAIESKRTIEIEEFVPSMDRQPALQQIAPIDRNGELGRKHH